MEFCLGVSIVLEMRFGTQMQHKRAGRYFHISLEIMSHILNWNDHNQRKWRNRVFYLKMF